MSTGSIITNWPRQNLYHSTDLIVRLTVTTCWSVNRRTSGLQIRQHLSMSFSQSLCGSHLATSSTGNDTFLTTHAWRPIWRHLPAAHRADRHGQITANIACFDFLTIPAALVSTAIRRASSCLAPIKACLPALQAISSSSRSNSFWASFDATPLVSGKSANPIIHCAFEHTLQACSLASSYIHGCLTQSGNKH
jgi:hypothetical protein